MRKWPCTTIFSYHEVELPRHFSAAYLATANALITAFNKSN